MPLTIVQVGDPVLRQRAASLTKSELRSRKTRQLIEAMRAAMHEAPGVGLAAPQVGLPLQLVVVEDKPEYTRDAPPEFLEQRARKPVPFHVIANPKIVDISEERAAFFEGCLSLKGFTAVVPRARTIRIECLDHQAEPRVIEASGWYARILQHEIDHLQGAMYIDRMHSRTFMSVEAFNQRWKDKSITEVHHLLGAER